MKTNPLTGKTYPKYYFDAERVETLLLLADEPISRKVIEGWTREQRHDAGDWALRCHCRASDNLNRVPPKPECVMAAAVPRDQRERGDTGTVFDLAPRAVK
jgi:hypothetical protein